MTAQPPHWPCIAIAFWTNNGYAAEVIGLRFLTRISIEKGPCVREYALDCGLICSLYKKVSTS